MYLLLGMSEAVLAAETKLGELLKSSSKGTFKKGGEKSLPEGISKKDSHYAQALADNKPIVEQVKKEAMQIR